ncbi:protoporphyrinogen/coproporphyrinogen oxidase [Calycomorphotria hydatis]|uniref:Amine oxidase domain-containing protein n=1 Tax=Calycomorphotria hydatis TaxID=2528027 RepID=A0A517T7B9_9PLAN|nr:FAD-dependent oxidoreductase [Calycomorphotria hydatis]QDT64273.1 hypothetical protein V22_15050 [Calycomorphotria hydatis]
MGGVVILGAGLSGLGCALELPGSRMYEAKSHLGGRAYSHVQGGCHFDQGAHISHTKNAGFIELTDRAAGRVVRFGNSNVKNYWDGSWMTYPVQNHLHELPTGLRIEAVTDLVNAHVDCANDKPGSYYDWCRAQYGNCLAENFYRIFTQKYWRCQPEDLATDWLGGRLLPSQLPRILAGAIAPQQEEQAAFAKFRYPAEGGYFRFFESLYESVDVKCNCRAAVIDTRSKYVEFENGAKEYFDNLVSSIPLNKLVHIIKDVPSRLIEAAQELHATQMLCVNMIIDRPGLTDAHWFYVYDPDIDVARVSVPSNLAPESAPRNATVLQAEIFRHDTEILDPTELVPAAQKQMQKMLGFNESEVSMINHVHVPQAYIVSDHRRGAIVDELLEWLEQNGVHSVGLYGRWRYVWSDVAFVQGQQTALKIKGQQHAAA